MTRVKGSNISFVRSFLEERMPGVGFAQVRALLPAADGAVIDSVIAAGWYDLSLQHRVFAALDQVRSEAGCDGITEFAHYTAEQDLTRAHRLFLRLRNPAFVLEKAGEYWGRFYDAGAWDVQRISPTRARGVLAGITDPHPIFCRFLTGYITRMFQLVGAKSGVAVHSRCVCRGAAACLFEGQWSDDPSRVTEPPPRRD